MDAALIELRPSARFRIGCECCTGHNHIGCSQCLAFVSFHRISGCLIEARHNAAAELRDFSERVHFAAIVRCGDGLANPDRQIWRDELPCRNPVCRVQLVLN